MKIWKLSKSLLFVALASLFFFACEKEKIDNSDQLYPIELSVEKPGRNGILNWTKTNISDFEGYFLMSSTEPIEDALEPVGAFRVIDDFEETTFEDSFFPLAEEVYYKVYVKSGDRFFFSPTVTVKFEVNLLDMQANRFAHDEDAEVLFLYDNNLQTIFRYDLKTSEITHEKQELIYFDFVMEAGDAGLGSELFLAKTNFSNLKILNGEDLSQKHSFTTNGQVQSIEVGDGVFFVATENFFTALTVYERSSLSELETSDIAQGFERRLGLMPGPDKILVDCSFEEFIVYQFNDNWNITNFNELSIFSNPLQDVVMSANGEHFIPNLDGMVFNLNLDLIGSVNSQNTNFSQDFVFSEDGESIFTFNFSPGRITEFSFPDMEEINSFNLNYNPIKAFRSKNGELIVIGWVQENFGTKTYVDVVEL